MQNTDSEHCTQVCRETDQIVIIVIINFALNQSFLLQLNNVAKRERVMRKITISSFRSLLSLLSRRLLNSTNNRHVRKYQERDFKKKATVGGSRNKNTELQ